MELLADKVIEGYAARENIPAAFVRRELDSVIALERFDSLDLIKVTSWSGSCSGFEKVPALKK